MTVFPDFAPLSTLFEVIRFVSILLALTILGWLVRFGLNYLVSKIDRPRKWQLAPHLLNSTATTLFALAIIEGFFIGLSSLSAISNYIDILEKVNIASLIALLTYGLAQGTSALFYWYLRRAGVKRKAIDEGLSLFVRRAITLIVYLIGLMGILTFFGVSVSAVLAGLGIGGIAIALALQPTLGNFFAGSQIVSDRIVRTDDYIELENGLSGYVVDIGWRSTKIRTVFNNMVVIPNSKLADSILTNYYVPNKEMGVLIEVGVSYSSDLEYVRAVSLEVANEVIANNEDAVPDKEPWVYYVDFGDSNVNLKIWVHAKDRTGTFKVKTDLMEKLHQRYKKEGITINYPVRHIISQTESK